MSAPSDEGPGLRVALELTLATQSERALPEGSMSVAAPSLMAMVPPSSVVSSRCVESKREARLM